MSEKAERRTRTLHRATALGLAALFLASASVAQAASGDSRYQYNDRDAHPARIVSYGLHPVGTILEWVILRPLHFVGSRLAPHRRHSDAVDLGCQQERPSANCTDVID